MLEKLLHTFFLSLFIGLIFFPANSHPYYFVNDVHLALLQNYNSNGNLLSICYGVCDGIRRLWGIDACGFPKIIL